MPVLIFLFDHHAAGFHENHVFNLIESLGVHLLLYLEVVQINFSLMNITVDIPLVDYSFVCLGDDSNKIIQQNDDHKHCLEEPDSPGESNNAILR